MALEDWVTVPGSEKEVVGAGSDIVVVVCMNVGCSCCSCWLVVELLALPPL